LSPIKLASGVKMQCFESKTHSFVVKIWLEEDEPPRWRGHITHVPGGERRYVEGASDIVDFIASYAEGIKATGGGLIRRWLAGRRPGGERG
jgi:hypothetical protein